MNTLSESARTYIQEHDISIQPYTLDLDYNFWTAGNFLFSSTLMSQMKFSLPLSPQTSKRFQKDSQQ
jgi:hypothetical protein